MRVLPCSSSQSPKGIITQSRPRPLERCVVIGLDGVDVGRGLDCPHIDVFLLVGVEEGGQRRVGAVGHPQSLVLEGCYVGILVAALLGGSLVCATASMSATMFDGFLARMARISSRRSLWSPVSRVRPQGRRRLRQSGYWQNNCSAL